ncbi:MAG: Holliday junction branch migration protein RuvA [Anaeromassilibacillus sp.]
MFYSIKGTLTHMEPGFVVVECAGVGFKCLTTLSTQRTMPQIGEQVKLFTHLNVREDAMDLFGFATMMELNCFKMLTAVSGVGPKVGLAILSELSPEQVAMAAASGDSKSLTRASGVGAKLAQRIVLELKDKVKRWAAESWRALHQRAGCRRQRERCQRRQCAVRVGLYADGRGLCGSEI